MRSLPSVVVLRPYATRMNLNSLWVRTSVCLLSSSVTILQYFSLFWDMVALVLSLSAPLVVSSDY